MMERWKVIDGFPCYAVSDHGRVRRETHGAKPAGTLLAVRLDNYGYPRVGLYKEGNWRKSYGRRTHMLVALAHIGPKPTPKHEVAHGDGDKTNAHVKNLRWATRQENRDDMSAHGRLKRAATQTPKRRLERKSVEPKWSEGVTIERLREVLSYCAVTGEFRWIATRNGVTEGTLAGSRRRDGRVLIVIDYKRFYAHRLAWLYRTGKWPSGEIDHMDGDPSNNRWDNLRVATRAQNAQNRGMQSNNTFGTKGVSRRGDRFTSRIVAHGEYRNLGTFKTESEAIEAYRQAAEEMHGEFARAA